jgi:hypothetical protein
MKKFLLLLTALLITERSMATPPPKSLVEYEQIAASKKIGDSQYPLQSLSVFLNGTVVAKITKAHSSTIVTTLQLDTTKMDQIIELAKEARDGEVKRVNPGIACFRANEYLHQYTLANKHVMLFRGHECNGTLLVNQSPAAKKLLVIVDQLRAKAFKTPSAR